MTYASRPSISLASAAKHSSMDMLANVWVRTARCVWLMCPRWRKGRGRSRGERPRPYGPTGRCRQLLHDQRGDHAEHAVSGFGVVEDVAVVCPHTRFAGLDEHVDALARG